MIHGELDWIVMKALEKERTRRYETASGLAADVEHYLNDEQVEACPPSAAYRLRKFVRRNAVVMTTGVIVITALLLGTVVSTWQAIRATKAEVVATQERNAAIEAQGKAQTASREADEQRHLAEEARNEAADEAERNRRLLYMSNMNLAIDAWDEANIGKVVELLRRHTPKANEPDYRGFEWYYLWKLSHAADVTIPHGPHVIVYGDGNLLATSVDIPDTLPKPGTLRFWHSKTGEEVSIRDNEMLRLLASYGRERDLRAARNWSPRLWKLSDDRRVLAAQEKADTPTLWNTETLEPISKLWTLPQDSPYRSIGGDFSPDGALFATANWDSTIRLFDVKSGELIHVFRGHDDISDCVAFSSDGRYLASGSRDRTIKLWEVGNRAELATLQAEHSNWIACLAFSPDGSMLASGGYDNRLVVWDVTKRSVLSSHRGHSSTIASVAFLREGQSVVTGSWDGTVKVWHLSKDERTVFAEHKRDVMSVDFSQDGAQLGSAGLDGSIHILDPKTGRKLRQQTFDGIIYDIEYSPDGHMLAIAHNASSATRLNEIVLWDTDSKTIRPESKQFDHNIWDIEFSPDGKLLAGISDSEVKLFDMRTGDKLWTISDSNVLSPVDQVLGWPRRLRFSPDGTTIGLAGGDDTGGYVQLCDVLSGEVLSRFDGHQLNVGAISFSPDGQLIASASFDETAIVWSVDTGRPLKTLRGHSGWVGNVLFSSDGSTLFTGANDGTIKLWDVKTGEEKFTLRGHRKGISCLSLSPDGNTLVSGSWDRTVRFWRAATREECSVAKW